MKRVWMSGAAVLALVAGAAHAAPVGDITSEVIFGSGNANGGFTVASNGALELGLRAKLRYDSAGLPQNQFNYNPTTMRYEFDPANSSALANRSIFNFEWSINTDTADTDDTPDAVISDYTYEMGVDLDPGAGTTFLSGGFDPYNLPYADHAFGYNSTGNGDGLTAPLTGFQAFKDTYNISQQSWNPGFSFLGGTTAPGVYDFYLKAFDGRQEVAMTSIQVYVGPVAPIPVPAAFPLLALALGGLGLATRRRKTA